MRRAAAKLDAAKRNAPRGNCSAACQLKVSATRLRVLRLAARLCAAGAASARGSESNFD
jgi:hypothetical protein